MLEGPLHVWNKWAIQILVLLSFGLQIILLILASTRRCRSSTPLWICLRVLLWLAYLMADSTAIYTLGHLSISGWLPEHELVAFWAPFILLHLGSQDNITAYALEDNQLWPRHLLTLGVQAVGVGYVLYKHMIYKPSMVIAAYLIFMVGFLKYWERTCALKRATLDNIRSSIKSRPSRDEPIGSAENDTRVPGEEELLLFAHHVLPTCMGEHIGKVVKLELSLMYDILYTKATVMHHWYGYQLRAISPLATIVALLLFHSNGKYGHAKMDVVITYILFGGALLLDIVSLVTVAMSTWTCDILDNMEGWGKTLSSMIQSFRLRVKAASTRGWSGSIGQYNLFDVSSRDMTKTSIRVLQMIKLDDWWKKYQYKGTLVIRRDVRELWYEEIWWTTKKNDDLSGLFDVKLPEGNIELQDVIFAVQSPCVGAIMALSNYMMFLAVARHDMLPSLKLRSMCEQTSDALQDIWSKAPSYQRVAGFGCYTTVTYGVLFAKELLPETVNYSANELYRSSSSEDRMDKRCRAILWRILPQAHTPGNLSVEQLNCGGELITIAWILTEHFHSPSRP
ncbi:hypothetical protein VPH35_102056 [Triticum aestivum]